MWGEDLTTSRIKFPTLGASLVCHAHSTCVARRLRDVHSNYTMLELFVQFEILRASTVVEVSRVLCE